MKKETVHIISHSHWDREWYLPLEEHRLRLVELFDDLFELFETDPDFKSFHLDGQLIVLEDYLAIRPQEKERLLRYIEEGRLIIGPFYILQDDYLITSEANMRNTLIGHLEGKKWGKMPKIGYFPDTFGNMGQAPQLLKQAGIDVAFFGRGVKPVGFDNQVLEDDHFNSTYSEMYWEGADGTQILGILFANWYSNGNEIPVDKATAKSFWEKKLGEVRQYASTSQYLLMNGCDHQPVQKDLSQALAVARELYPDIEFVHSNFEDYVQALKAELPEDLSTVRGELISQETDGWYTLTNTASSRIYLKQENDKASHLLEKVVEPLVVMTQDEVPRDELRYAWKLLLENAPHDSICGCSIDPVHAEMETRFAKVQQVGNFLCQRSLERWASQVDSQDLDGLLFTVFNTSPEAKSQLVEVDLVVDKRDFRDGQLEKHYQDMSAISLPSYVVMTSQGEELAATIEDLGVSFAYELPKDRFRSATFTRKIRISLVLEDLPAFSWQTYQVKEGQTVSTESVPAGFENDFLAISVNKQQELVWLDKASGQSFTDFLRFEDTGDVGNEYIYMAPKGEEPILSELVSVKWDHSQPLLSRATLLHRLQIPRAMDDQLLEEQEKIIEFRHRTAQRSKETVDVFLETDMLLYAHSPQVQFKTRFKNEALDHRIRVLFDFGIQSDCHEADSIYEVVTRSNQPHPSWENPSYPLRHRTFVSMQDKEKLMLVSSKGLHEYEILNSQVIALTLLRAVGELGDWGYFPTPQAQCLRDISVEYAVELQSPRDKYAAIHRAQAFQTDLLTVQIKQQTGTKPVKGHALEHPILSDNRFCITSLKVAEESDDILLRYYHLSTESVELSHKASGVNLLEHPIGDLASLVSGQEIRTEIVTERS
ncbi:alpha-mannosidase [Streptococcus cameli]